MTTNHTLDDDVKVSADGTVLSPSGHTKAGPTEDSYEGRKHKPQIDGPQQDSQETDEVYVDPRHEAGLPASGKNVADLNVNDLSQKGNE